MKRVVTAVTCVLTVTWGAVAPMAAPPAPPSTGGADRTINCESHNYRYRYCRVDTDNRVRLERQISVASRCRFGDTWGYDSRGVWVDRGCQAEFRVGRDGGEREDRGGRRRCGRRCPHRGRDRREQVAS